MSNGKPNGPCPHCEEYQRKGDELLKKYLARGREMAREQDEFERQVLELQEIMTASLRDQFAMAAIWAPLGSAEDIARLSYAIADAMLEARKT